MMTPKPASPFSAKAPSTFILTFPSSMFLLCALPIGNHCSVSIDRFLPFLVTGCCRTEHSNSLS
jgi:hypothetical protein